MKSVISSRQGPSITNPRSKFNISRGYKTAFDSQYLIPCFIEEVVPGDTIQCKPNIFARLATAIVPIMDNIFLDIHFFFVPIRLIWTKAKNFFGEAVSYGKAEDYLIPILNAEDAVTTGSIYDYFGLPIMSSSFTVPVNSLPFRAYNLIFNEWYRDQNLTNRMEVPLTDGPDDMDYFYLRKRCKMKDYFTTCLPWPQKHDDILLPLGDIAPVVGNGLGLGLTDGTNDFTLMVAGPNGQFSPGLGYATDIGAGTTAATPPTGYVVGVPDDLSGAGLAHSGLVADLSQATASTLADLRRAFALQRIYELDAIGGSRYIEIVKTFFGVTSSDARVDRPELLAAGSTRVNINPVAQTSQVDGQDTPIGYQAATGAAFLDNGFFTKSFEEHGYVIGIASVRADLFYQYGLQRLWSRRTREDFFWPQFEEIGDQPVYNKEIFCEGDTGVEGDEAVFGYQERYAEYKRGMSLITGKMRSVAQDSLDVWHLAERNTSLPVLSRDWLETPPPLSDVIATPGEPEFIVDMFFETYATRPMRVYSMPGLSRL